MEMRSDVCLLPWGPRCASSHVALKRLGASVVDFRGGGGLLTLKAAALPDNKLQLRYGSKEGQPMSAVGNKTRKVVNNGRVVHHTDMHWKVVSAPLFAFVHSFIHSLRHDLTALEGCGLFRRCRSVSLLDRSVSVAVLACRPLSSPRCPVGI
ncbi:hypothetical protein LX32DRAFT_447524 [Colletotrichum zoysiae]|uniref:Uncharacterized protein n=1 Tax=Colletotrichum zoysiae TaxID=1216348 RepID=A0AAD9LZY9_9PEZI|nr:hypothetical protein LX32DRAFT_447524 [Colletotrichum zoysiae]